MILLAVVALLLGLLALGYGFLCCFDAEGRAHSIVYLMVPAGASAFLWGLGYIGWRFFGMVFGG